MKSRPTGYIVGSDVINTHSMKCHLCGKDITRGPIPFRSHMRVHLRNGEITRKKELEIRMNLNDYRANK
jgi:hypothetical protein